MKTLICFFSAENGTTAKAAKDAARALGFDLFEITPEQPYTAADLRYTNPLARCNREKFGKKDVPVAGRIENFDDYDTVLIGFPMWCCGAPDVVNTFCSVYYWCGKKIAAFATSGGSGIGKTAERLRPYLTGGELLGAKLVHSGAELADWAKEIF